ncbi:unannotated protein [freshwater metagenome]|uniref:Unannotated protein n=1 Tax=freshwater metagenome TaxID=449393 RepID=A0A6J6W172_9ZZZZ
MQPGPCLARGEHDPQGRVVTAAGDLPRSTLGRVEQVEREPHEPALRFQRGRSRG